MPALSLIVPVYNVARWLDACVESLLRQDIDDYEILLVDDGSTDGSGTLADAWAEKSPRIRVLHQSNIGLGAARNSGVAASTGRYVQFVDSDDTLGENVLGTLLQRMEAERLDVLRFNYRNIDESGQEFRPYKDVKVGADYRESVCSGPQFLTERLGHACYAVQFLLRRELSVRFPFPTGVYFEDTRWAPQILLEAERVNSMDIVAYNYRLRSGSITMAVSPEKKRKVLEDQLSLMAALKEMAAQAPDRRWFEGMTAHTAVSVVGSVSGTFWKERRVWLKRLRALDVYPLSRYMASPRVARKIALINFSPALACRVLHWKNG